LLEAGKQSLEQAPTETVYKGEEVGKQLYELYTSILAKSEKTAPKYPMTSPQAELSRDNLLAYLALREKDIFELQMSLSSLGLSSLGRLESHVISNIESVMSYLSLSPVESSLKKVTFAQAVSLLGDRSRALLGRPREGRATRIMVTLDSAYIYQPELLEQLLVSGMDIARINCAHDSQRDWLMLINAIRAAEERLVQRGKGIGRTCRILMDLAGPKIRTGPLDLEIRPLKLSVPKDPGGRASKLLEGLLDSDAQVTEKQSLVATSSSFTVAIKSDGKLSNVTVGENLTFKDARDRSRSFIVLEKLTSSKVRVGLPRTAYLEEGTRISTKDGVELIVGPIKPQPVDLEVKVGDKLRLFRDPSKSGMVASAEEPAGISCTLPEALDQVKAEEHVFIDDGKIGTIVREVKPEYLLLEVLTPTDSAASIKSEKGLNFPDSAINIPALTDEDRKNLDFVSRHATAVGLSFVHRAEDLDSLHMALKELGHDDLGIIAKIETKEAVHKLGEILLAGLNLPKFGILIARGDLAVEVGFENLAFVQEDILCMCEAAHVPVVFATQVLETLAKSGLPSRAEITDAAMGTRAECVMLNKGPHILEATRTLAGLLHIEERHQLKKRQIFREFTQQSGVFD
jgi:pyruvate kinase